MKPTTSTVLSAAAGVALCVFAIVAIARGDTPAETSQTVAERVEHGRYVVHQLGLCIDCHSPRDARGQFVTGQHLMGATLAFQPTVPMPWAAAAPRLAGLPPGYTPEHMVEFLMTGKRPHGLPPANPPMPEYRMSRADADAVVAYLQTLPINAK